MTGPAETSDLVVIETHPIQYHAPVYRCLQQRFGLKVTTIYGSDFSIAGALDPEFNRTVAWDSDLLSGYSATFLSRVQRGAATEVRAVRATGLAQALQRARPRALLLPGYGVRFYRQAFLCARRSRTPIVFRGETTDHAVARSRPKQRIRNMFLRYFYKRCAALLYIGARSREHFRRFEDVTTDKLFYSPYCVDTSPFQTAESARERFRAAQRKNLGITDDQILLLFSGKLSPRKGPDQLLQSVALLPDDLRNRVAVVFMGDGEMNSALRSLAETLRVQTHFAGFQNQTQLSSFYHAADLLAVPSRHSETWGLVVNEALHHGLPCVVSDAVGCKPDLITEGLTGECSPTDCLSGFAQAIQRALPLIRSPRVRQHCRDRVESYSIENAARGIARAYESVI
jgi:glycosyltransferase involved in cell wall biosynthesis